MAGKSPLERVLKIDDEVIKLKNDPTYRKIRKNLKKLEQRNFGLRTLSIPAPHDLNKTIEIQKYSDEMDAVKEKYRDRLFEFESKLDSLYQEKRDLKKKIFG
ncbi:MAG: hypothetical protein PVJ38_07965 [Candidatus Bathyarchaeota archaeon]